MLSGCKELAKLPIGDYFEDMSVNSSVKAALAADKSLESVRIDVETKERVVFLKGNVTSEEQKTRAEQIVFQVSGVRGVANILQVQQAP
jgi:osmotically-inducible protein OsmY